MTITKNIKEVVEHINKNTATEKRLDAGETAILELQLEHLRAQVYEVKYEEFKARSFFPTLNDAEPWANTYAFEQTDTAGVAKIIENLTDDIPSVDVQSEKLFNQVVTIGDSWSYSIQDLRKSAILNEPLDSRKARQARKAAERGLDSLAAIGSSRHGIEGFINNSNVSITAASGSLTSWDAGTPATEMLADLNNLVKDMIVGNKETITPDTVLLPLQQYLVATQTLVDTQNPRTVMESFRAANPTITMVAPWNVLSGSGASSKNRGVCYQRSDEVCGLVVTSEYEITPPQPKNLGFNVFGHLRSAGCIIFSPAGVRYIDGI